jgi:hypothetical protein
MRIRVEVVCAPHPREDVKAALRSAGRQLALRADSVSVRIDPAEPRVAILTFDMHRAAQYQVVDDVYETVTRWAWAFYEDCTVQFPD